MTRKKTILLGLLIMMLALVFTGVARVLLLSRDDPSVNDADLQLTRLDIPDEENAWFYFEKAAREFDPTYDQLDKYTEQITTNPALRGKGQMPSRNQRSEVMAEKATAILEASEWQADQAKSILEQNQKVLEYFEKGMTCPNSQISEFTVFNLQSGIGTPLRHIARLNTIRAISLFKAGQEKEALDETMKTIRFGQQIENSGGLPIHFLVGSAIKARGLERFQNFLCDTSLSSEMLKLYVAELKQYRVTPESWSNTFKQDYHYSSEMIDAAINEKNTGNAGPQAYLNTYTLLPHFFLPNNSKNLYAELYRVLIENGRKHYNQRKPLPPYRYQGLISHFLGRNGTGKLLIGITAPSLDNILTTKCNENNGVAATRCMIALKCYQLDHGGLPESLAQLVPMYLDAVPLDDFDGKPLRYNREKKILYSVGEDLIDNGGTEKDAYGRKFQPGTDITFIVETLILSW